MKSEKRNALWMVLFLIVGLLAMPVAQISYIGAFVVLLVGCIGFSAMLNRIAHTVDAREVASEKELKQTKAAA